jgi:hypothetical protein
LGNDTLSLRIWGSHSAGYEELYLLDITPCSPLKFNGRFGGTCRLNPQGRITCQARNQRESCSKPSPKHKLEMIISVFSPFCLSTSTVNLSLNWLRTVLLCLLSASRWFLVWLVLRPWGWRRHVPPKRRLAFNGLHGVISFVKAWYTVWRWSWIQLRTDIMHPIHVPHIRRHRRLIHNLIKIVRRTQESKVSA